MGVWKAGHVIPAKAGIYRAASRNQAIGFADLACPEPAVLRVQWIPACAGMTICKCVSGWIKDR
jgi:hypothetical protein